MSLESVFDASYTLTKYRGGPLGKILDAFCDWLLERGHSQSSVRLILSHVSHLNQFLETKRVCRDRLSDNDIDSFFKAYPRMARNRGPLEKHIKRVRWSVHRFVQYLQQQKRYECKDVKPIFFSVLQDYLQWMQAYRNVGPGTLDVRRHCITTFLSALGPKATYEGLVTLSPETVESFFLSYAENYGPAARRSMQAALRTFLRFCFQKGAIQQRLDKAVPTLHGYKLATVPRGLSCHQAQEVLQCVDRATAVGKRDYAILQLLYTYGIRGGQVRALRLGDIHWSTNQILFKALKNGKDSWLPLTDEVGKSLLDYLKKARPDYACPEVFLTSRAPYHRIHKTGTLSAICQRYIQKAGVDIPTRGSHAWRHCFASRMVQSGHSLKSIADVLGHRALSTTFIYTKVDINALKQVALEWPQQEVQ